MAKNQTFENHTRFDPPFHLFLAPVLLMGILIAVYATVRDWPSYSRLHLWWIVMAITLFLLAGTVRRYAAKNQDRLIRLEERLRLSALLPASEAALIQSLSTRQLIALRFASDSELPALARRAVAENLSSAEIKKSIVTWRPDNDRV